MPKRQIVSDINRIGRDPLEPFFRVEREILQELEPIARRLQALAEDETFSSEKSRELRERFVSGVIDWAIRQMNGKIERLVEEGKTNYLDHFTALLQNPWRDRPRDKDTFWEAFKKAEFYIPSRLSREILSHRDWPAIWREYVKAHETIEKIAKKRWRNPVAKKMSYKENLPGLSDDQITKLLNIRKPSDQSFTYVKFKFKLSVDIEALKKSFRVFHKDPQYGYYDFVLDRLIQIKKK